MNLEIIFLIIWSIMGLYTLNLFLTHFNKPKDRWEAFIIVVICGPISWLMFLLYSLFSLIKFILIKRKG